MGELRQRQALLNERAIQSLHHAKRQIIDAALNRIAPRLVLATAEGAMRLARHETVSAELVPERARELAWIILRDLAQGKWKPDTALKMERAERGGSHELFE